MSFYQQNEEVLALEKTVYFKSKKELLNYTKDVRNENLRKGYVLANIDSLAWKDSISASAYMYRGPQFDRLKISVAEQDRFLIRKIPRLSERFLRNASFYPAEVERVLSEVLSFLENNGFPYASVCLIWDGVYASENQAELIIKRGPEVILTKIHIKGEAEVSEKFLTNLIAIKEGDYFNQERLERISARIKQTLFLNEIKPHELLFTPEGFELFLYLKTAPVSLVNGVVGLQPNSVTGKSVFTGDVRLRLQNVLKRGELFDVNWRSLQPQTQDLKIKLNYPFLLNTPFGIDGAFDLYKRDTNFLTTVGRIGVQYFLSGGSYIKVFYEGENSNLLSGAQSSSLGNLSSVSSNRYGLGFFRRQLDYLPNPSKGFFIEVNGLIGARTSRLPASDSVTSSTTYAARLDLEWFVPLAKRHVLRITNNTRAYYAPEVFTNELNRFGGLTTQRGFDEEELFASKRSTFTVEYRFLVDKNSHAFLFYDQSFYENSAQQYYFDSPFGTGAGFSFGTNIGVFSISYGIGKQFDNPMLLREGKVHFGYVSFF
ncbi:MAG: POTRA domain-containing protein [Crocinitomicaceae bacterium]|nr:POTRA domain-containing protein [Crocinitomicaceae bacterium]